MENWNLHIAFLSIGSKRDQKNWPVVVRNVITETIRPHNATNVTCPNYFSGCQLQSEKLLLYFVVALTLPTAECIFTEKKYIRSLKTVYQYHFGCL
jgi:hypothetical protein